jgi:hypothetical protein
VCSLWLRSNQSLTIWRTCPHSEPWLDDFGRKSRIIWIWLQPLMDAVFGKPRSIRVAKGYTFWYWFHGLLFAGSQVTFIAAL